jgi:hypothetical protein
VAKVISPLDTTISSGFKTIFFLNQNALSQNVAFEVGQAGDKKLACSLAPLVKVAVKD